MGGKCVAGNLDFEECHETKQVSCARFVLLPNWCHSPFAVRWVVDIGSHDWISLSFIVTLLLEPGALP